MSVLPSCSRCPQSAVVYVALIFALFQQTCSAKHHTSCPSSSCGEIGEIKYPFRLKGDPGGCGLPSYELDCVNNRTLITLFSGKYYVKEINYDRYDIRVLDSGVVEDTSCSFPRYFLSYRNFSGHDTDRLNLVCGDFYATVVFLNCSDRVGDDPRYVEVKAGCCDSGGVIYAVHHVTGFTVMDVKAGCSLKIGTLANGRGFSEVFYTNKTHGRNVSYADIVQYLEEGFWLSWFPLVCRNHGGKGIHCDLNHTTQQIQCNYCTVINYRTHNFGEIYILLYLFCLPLS
ncbi:hypothetical protein V8G54_036260 [Vigna mungo]|uniref:Wall-associated receptor kinase galacturonan-binding domain-containing protein n=1 Tax=Vigna mungo TaxID=3915 RepID=A0AAQ3RE87_VIGMU